MAVEKDRRKDIGGKVLAAVLIIIVVGILTYGVNKADANDKRIDTLAISHEKHNGQIQSLTQMLQSQQTLNIKIVDQLSGIQTSIAVIEERTKIREIK